jgi:hypothetical protein
LTRALIFGTALILSLIAARRNYVRGRGDRSGALKIAFFVMSTVLVARLMRVAHTTVIASEWAVLSAVIADTFFAGAQVWLAYMALEPYVRRHQPEMLISWSRVLRGNWRDPLVGRHVLLGCFFGMVVNLLFAQLAVAGGALFGRPALPNSLFFGLGEWSSLLANLFGQLGFAPVQMLAYVFLLIVAKAFLKTDWIVAPLIIAVGSSQFFGRGLGSPSEIVFVTLGLSFIYVALRFSGLLGSTVATATATFVNSSIFILEPSSWIFGQALASVAVIAAITIWAFKSSLGVKPILGNVQWVE